MRVVPALQVEERVGSDTRSFALIKGRRLIAGAAGADDRAGLSHLDPNLMNATIATVLLGRVVRKRVARPDLFGDGFEYRREVFRVSRKVSPASQRNYSRDIQQGHAPLTWCESGDV